MTEELNKLKIAAAILAGGNSRRLGGLAKGTIKTGNGVSIIDKLIKELAMSDISDIVIVANDSTSYRNYGVKIISDIRVGIGPIGGIEAGLVHFTGQADAVMFVPCDMPNITAKEMSDLKQAFIETDSPVVFAETPGFFLHPLCAIVHNGLKGKISSAIDNGQRKIRDVWRQAKAVTVHFPEKNAFFNINDLADLDRWKNEKANFC